jgi:integrase
MTVPEDELAPLDKRYYFEDKDRHGNDRRYARKRLSNGKWRKIRLRKEPGTPESLEEFAAAIRQLLGADTKAPDTSAPEHVVPSSLRWLVNEYYKSQAFLKELDSSTRGVRRNILEVLCNEPSSDEDPTPIGRRPFNVPVEMVQVLLDRKADLTESANGRLKAMRGLYAWASSDGVKHMKTNPAKAVDYLKGDNPDGFYTWTIADVEQFKQRHPTGTKAFLAMHLILLLGQRRSDIVQFGKQHIRKAEHMAERLRKLHAGRWLNFTQFKGRKKKPVTLTIPILPQLEEVIAESPCGELTFLVTSFNKPFTAAGFGNWFRDRCNEAGLPQCSAHGLRKAGATIAAENGASTHILKAIFGWSTLKQAEIYTKKAEQVLLAGSGMSLLISDRSEDQSANECGPPFSGFEPVGQLEAKKPRKSKGENGSGSPGWIRTSDHSINSRMLYR